MKNERCIYLAVTFAIMVLGLASRKYDDVLPEFIAEYSGDTLWAAMVYWGIRFLFPSISIVKSVVISLLFSDRKSTRLNSSHIEESRMPSSA